MAIPNVGQYVKQQELLHTTGGSVQRHHHFVFTLGKKGLQFLIISSIPLPHDPTAIVNSTAVHILVHVFDEHLHAFLSSIFLAVE